MKIADKCQEILNLYKLEESILISGTDKGSGHSYIEYVYGPLFDIAPPKSILEIGIKSGASLVLWQELFPESFILGVDNDLTNFRNIEALNLQKSGKINVVETDAYSKEFINSLNYFDFIIDDGPHTHDSQMKALDFTQKLSSVGTLVIEDIYPRFSEISKLMAKSKEIHNSYAVFINMLPNKGRYDDLVLIITFNNDVKDFLRICEKSWTNRMTSNRLLFAFSKILSRHKFYRNLFVKSWRYCLANKRTFIWGILSPYRWR